MTKLFSVLLFFLCSTNVWALEMVPKIEVTKDKFVTIVFPSGIQTCHTGFDPENFVIKHNRDILTLQPLVSFSGETNLMIETNDGAIYLIDVIYVDKLTTSFFKFSVDLARDHRGIENRSSSVTNNTGVPVPNKATSQEICVDSVLQKISQLPSYITMSNGSRLKNIEAYVKGIFVKDESLYFQIQFINGSDIQYNFDFIGFSTVTKAKKGMSIERTELPIHATYIPQKKLGRGQIMMVVKVAKFTLSSSKFLLIELFEGNGERNLSLKIDPSTLLMAKTFN